MPSFLCWDLDRESEENGDVMEAKHALDAARQYHESEDRRIVHLIEERSIAVRPTDDAGNVGEVEFYTTTLIARPSYEGHKRLMKACSTCQGNVLVEPRALEPYTCEDCARKERIAAFEARYNATQRARG